jgi:hypothetical protein
MKSIKDILVSPGFMREVSLLLFVFAAFSGLFAVVLLTASGSDPEAFDLGIGLLVQAIVYAVLGAMVRRRSLKALWVAGVLFFLDTLLALVMPSSGKGVVTLLLSRGSLIYLLVRYVRRQRALAEQTPDNLSREVLDK